MRNRGHGLSGAYGRRRGAGTLVGPSQSCLPAKLLEPALALVGGVLGDVSAGLLQLGREAVGEFGGFFLEHGGAVRLEALLSQARGQTPELSAELLGAPGHAAGNIRGAALVRLAGLRLEHRHIAAIVLTPIANLGSRLANTLSSAPRF